jgi:hypothetical protein
MSEKIHGFLPAAAEMPTVNQRLYARYLNGVFVDLVVLNLFAQYWSSVHVDHFSMSLLVAALMQALLKVTIYVEHLVGEFFAKYPGRAMRFLRYFSAWLVLFGSKFVILEALAFVFGDGVRFDGALHGIVALIVVAVAMIVAEELVVRIFRRIG